MPKEFPFLSLNSKVIELFLISLLIKTLSGSFMGADIISRSLSLSISIYV